MMGGRRSTSSQRTLDPSSDNENEYAHLHRRAHEAEIRQEMQASTITHAMSSHT
jgi:hypothetical protein